MAFLSRVRVASVIALTVGAIGSLGLMFRAGQHAPPLLLVAFVFWIASPFVALMWATNVSKRWSAGAQGMVYATNLLIGACSLAVYGELVNLRPSGSPNAFLFVVVPPVSMAVIGAAVLAAVLMSRRSA